jgi:hypothetical protein
MVALRHHGREVMGGAMRAIDASIAWHLAQPAEWRSAAARSSPTSVPSIQAASVSASTH